MSVDRILPVLDVPARTIPVPSSVSPEAQAMLAMGRMELSAAPASDDVDGWRAAISAINAAVLPMLGTFMSSIEDQVQVDQMDLGDGLTVFDITPVRLDPEDRRVYLDIHGGGFIMGGGELCRGFAMSRAIGLGMRVWAADYRMPPDHSYPTPLDDCLRAYRALLEQCRTDQIVVGGESAGGNLVAALILRGRDEGLPLPAAAVLHSPELDLTQSGDSFQTNLGVDTVINHDLMSANLLYAHGHDLADPYLSPLFGDFSKGFPPTLLSSGTRDLFLSNAVRMHNALRAAGIVADLHVQEAAPHGGFRAPAPEAEDLMREVRGFIEIHMPSPSREGS